MSDLFVPRQTNTGLYVQMHEAGYTVDEICYAQKAYRLSCHLFNGRYRKSERAFICHAVGTASATILSKPSVEIVIAAMLHAAYDSGQFPDGRTGRRSVAHKDWLAREIGAEIESIVARLLDFDFGLGAPELLVEDGYPDNARDLLLIALSHEIDDLADGGLVFSPKYGESIASRVNACATIARQIELPKLATTIERYGAVYEDLSWTSPLRNDTLEGFRIAPNFRAYVRLLRDHWRGRRVYIN